MVEKYYVIFGRGGKMSRIGKKPVLIPPKVKVDIKRKEISIQGPKGSLSVPLPEGIQAKVENGKIIFERVNDSKSLKAFHGTTRALTQNAITGVTEGFTKILEIEGVGYKAQVEGKKLILSLGYSHPIEFIPPEGIEITAGVTPERKFQITLSGIDKEKVGLVAAKIKSYRPPDAYKLKGIRYAGEKLKKKERRTGVK
ncbi:MAG: 50S ribosomal protein L6 [Candidatus Aminicenantia bacterium]